MGNLRTNLRNFDTRLSTLLWTNRQATTRLGGALSASVHGRSRITRVALWIDAEPGASSERHGFTMSTPKSGRCKVLAAAGLEGITAGQRLEADAAIKAVKRIFALERDRRLGSLAEPNVCPNCEQWRSGPSADCFNECRKRGFAS